MTDRVRHLTVTLDRDIREDDVEHVIAAIRMVRLVARVTPVKLTLAEDLARTTVRHQIEADLFAAVRLICESGGVEEREVKTEQATIIYRPRKP